MLTEGLLTQLVFEHSLRIRLTAEGSEKAVQEVRANDATSAAARLPKLEAKEGGENLIGKINNLVTTDVTNIVEARDFLFLCECDDKILKGISSKSLLSYARASSNRFIYYFPPSNSWVEVSLYLRSQQIEVDHDISAFAGMTSMAILFPIPGYIARRMQAVQRQKMQKVGQALCLDQALTDRL